MAGKQRGVGGEDSGMGELAGSSPPCRVPGKGKDLCTRARLCSPGLSHPVGALNKSIQASMGPHTCGHNHRRMA